MKAGDKKTKQNNNMQIFFLNKENANKFNFQT